MEGGGKATRLAGLCYSLTPCPTLSPGSLETYQDPNPAFKI